MIGVSYTGHDGRKASFGVQGAEDAASRMAGLTGKTLRETMSDAQGILRMARKPGVQPQAQPSPQQRKERVMPGGSVVRSNEGALCLRGEELSPLVPGTKVYGAKNGDKGFFSFDEIDPPVRGAVVGKDVGDDTQSTEADGARKDLPDGVAWAIRVQTDVRGEQIDAVGLITVYKYFRRLYFSAAGRVVGCSEEWREVAFSFIPGLGGGGDGKYGVMPFFVDVDGDPVHPIPDAFAFGSESALDTWNAEKSRFDCNYDESGNVIENPPVKVVAVAACPGGMPEEWRG